jgi:hypothetical protein
MKSTKDKERNRERKLHILTQLFALVFRGYVDVLVLLGL